MAIEHGLAWLESRSTLFRSEEPGYAEFHLLSLWDHLELYKLVELDYPALRELADTLSRSPTFQKSRPG